MSDYIEILCLKYDVYFGSELSMVFLGYEYWDDSVGVLVIDVFVYCKEDMGRLYDVLIIVGMSCQFMNFLFIYEGECWVSELIWYFDEVDWYDFQII